MKTLCVLVHVPAVPYHYPFSKIGHYHKYFNNELQKKTVERIYGLLIELIKNINSFGEYNEVKLFISSYFASLCSKIFSSIKDLVYEQINWEYVLPESVMTRASIPDLPQNFKNVDFTTIQSIVKHRKNFKIINKHFCRNLDLNHLQHDVLKQVVEFKAKYGSEVYSNSQIAWFLQAEHLQWMSHEKEKIIFNSPFANAYDAYINYMNMLSDLKAEY